MKLSSIGFLLLMPLWTTCAFAQSASTSKPSPTDGGKIETGAIATSSYRNRLAWGEGVSDFMTWLSNRGIDYVASREMANLEQKKIQPLLAETGLPGALVLFDIQTSIGDTNINTFIGGQPHFIGAGLTPLQTYQAFTLSVQTDFYPKPSNGYVRNEADSKFLWITRDQNGFKYSIVDAQMLRNEVRRLRNDNRLKASLANTYELELIQNLAQDLEQNAKSKPLRSAAKALVASSKEAIEAKERLDADLRRELKKIERINVLMNQLETGMAFAQIFSAVRTEFKDKPALLDTISDPTALKAFLESENAAAQKHHGELKGAYERSDNAQTGRRRQLLMLFRDSNINLSDVPGLKPVP